MMVSQVALGDVKVRREGGRDGRKRKREREREEMHCIYQYVHIAKCIQCRHILHVVAMYPWVYC